jgi:mycofactocin biosynthetic radical S-adenosylmethionine protein MftC
MKYADWPLSAPVNLTWEITHRCNLRCIHCLSASSAASPGELSFNECRAVVDQVAALGVFEINFGGGEPLLKDHFLPLLRYIHEKDIVTCISTNGTVLTDEAVDCFTGSPLVNVQVSLDGADAAVNDRIRGAGTFGRIIGGIERLAGKDIPLSINTVVTSLNFEQLDRLKELAAFYGARLRVSRFRPSGRARQSWEELKLAPAQLRGLSAWLTADPAILTGDSFFSVTAGGRRRMGLDMCGACKMTGCIDPVGGVYPCAFMQEKAFCGGSLKTASFKDIWDGSAAFESFRRLEPESCRRCSRFDSCHGGCPAVAYFVSRDLNSADPECLASWSRETTAQCHSEGAHSPGSV